MKLITVHDMIKSLIGEIIPTGDTVKDAEIGNNINEMFELVENLLQDISSVAEMSDSEIHSISMISAKASRFIESIKS